MTTIHTPFTHSVRSSLQIAPSTRLSSFTPPVRPSSRPILVRGLNRRISVKIASETDEWESAFRLVADCYRARGYETADSDGLRFTPFHALRDTTTFVAQHEGQVIATLSLVPDNILLGLPLECIFKPEVENLRRAGRRLVEVTSLADCDLSLTEFVLVFTTTMRLLSQYAVRMGADAAVITINPRHRLFYRKVMGFQPLGPVRSYPSVQNAPAEAYLIDPELMRTNAPGMYQQIFATPLPEDAFIRRPMPSTLVRYFAGRSTQTTQEQLTELLGFAKVFGSSRRWR